MYELGQQLSGGATGTELLQTQPEAGGSFRHVKQGGAAQFSKWERLCATANYIWRDLDTSGDLEVYRLSEQGKPWSKWCARFMAVGEVFPRNPTVTWINKQTGQPVPGKQYAEASNIKLEWVKATWTVFVSGLVLQDVICLSYSHPGSSEWIERYYYSKGRGLVAWENRPADGGWKTYISVLQSGHPAPAPEQLGAWANPPPIPADTAPPQPQPPTAPAKPSNAADPVTLAVPSSYKLRFEPDTSGTQIGLLKTGETVTAYRVPETNNDGEVWHFIERAASPSTEAAQGYSAVPLPPPDVEPPDPEPELETFTMLATVTVPKGTDIAAVKSALEQITGIQFAPISKE